MYTLENIPLLVEQHPLQLHSASVAVYMYKSVRFLSLSGWTWSSWVQPISFMSCFGWRILAEPTYCVTWGIITRCSRRNMALYRRDCTQVDFKTIKRIMICVWQTFRIYFALFCFKCWSKPYRILSLSLFGVAYEIWVKHILTKRTSAVSHAIRNGLSRSRNYTHPRKKWIFTKRNILYFMLWLCIIKFQSFLKPVCGRLWVK